MALRPKGKLILVGVVMEPIPVSMFTLLIGQRMISASPTGSPAAMATMLNFAARHKILPTVETFKFSQVNEAIEKLKQGKIRYRAVLTIDSFTTPTGSPHPDGVYFPNLIKPLTMKNLFIILFF